MSKRIKLLGSYCDALTMEESLDRIEEFIVNKQCVQHVVINASKINLIQEDEKLRSIINNCPLINADGMSVVWASKFLGNPLPERVTGIDMFLKLVEIASIKGYSVYFFGAKQEVVEKVIETFKQNYPSLVVAGYRNGYFNEESSKQIAEEIRDSKSDILFVAFSSPKKEYWINEYMPIMQVPFAMGVGGSFDVVAGVTDRAPVWMQKSGLEWFYRFIQEPRRMFKRYIIGNIRFLILMLKCKFGFKRKI